MVDRVPPGSEMAAFGSPIIPSQHASSSSIPDPERDLEANPNSHPWLAAPDPEPDPDSNPNSHPWIAARERETYIVQVPKEQIYRVPPPENAALVERYRNQVETRTSRCPSFLKCLAWFLAVLLILAVLCVVIVVVFFITVRPGAPRFMVDRVYVTKGSSIEYGFTFDATNPSGAMGFKFEKGGKADLLSKGVRIASGKTSKLDLEVGNPKNESSLKVVLDGSRLKMPMEISKALNGGKDLVAVRVEMEIRVSVNAWGIDRNGMNMKVTCDVTVKGFVKEAGIKSQKCKTDFRWM